MTKLNVDVRNIDDDTLFTHKTIEVGSKSIDTPAKAIPIRKLTQKDQISPEARGFNELYFQVSPEQIEESRQSFDSSLKKRVRTALNRSREGEINVVFINYTSTEDFSDEVLEYIVDLIYSTSDILTIPLMPELLSAIKDDGKGTASTYFETYFKNIKRYVKTARQINGKPIMGVVPSLPRAFTDKIIEYYINDRIRAYCFNFNGRTVTAERQLTDMVTPLMRNVAVEDMEEDVFLYSLNAHRGRSVEDLQNTPARDFLTFGFGLDVLGDKHTGGDLPPELIEKISGSEPRFRLFDKGHYVYQSLEYGDQLRARLPTDTGLDIDRILQRKSENYRLATVLNGEQQAKEALGLRPLIDEYEITRHLDRKRGVQDKNLEEMKTARQSFDGNRNQSQLSELDDMLG